MSYAIVIRSAYSHKKEMPVAKLNREDRPPQGPKPLKLVRVKRGWKAVYTILSTSLFGVWTHWDGRTTIPCFKAKQRCQGCANAMPKRWKAYLHCYTTEADKDFLLELTPRACNMLLSEVPEGKMLRGLKIRVERSPGGRNGRLMASIVGTDPHVQRLPAAKDPYNTLAFLWGMDPLDDHPSQRLA